MNMNLNDSKDPYLQLGVCVIVIKSKLTCVLLNSEIVKNYKSVSFCTEENCVK